MLIDVVLLSRVRQGVIIDIHIQCVSRVLELVQLDKTDGFLNNNLSCFAIKMLNVNLKLMSGKDVLIEPFFILYYI